MPSAIAEIGTSATPVILAIYGRVGVTINTICVFAGGNIDAKGTTPLLYLSLT